LTVWAVDEAVDFYKLKVIAEAATKAMKFQNTRAIAQAEAERLRRINERVKLDNLAKSNNFNQRAILNAKKTNQKTCDFWISEFKRVKSSYAKDHMDSSCKRASGL